MKAKLLLRDKMVFRQCVVERTVWSLPQKDRHRPHGLKYRLHCGRKGGECLVRYDNEHGKGDHVHYGDKEVAYEFRSLSQLLRDFDNDIREWTR